MARFIELKDDNDDNNTQVSRPPPAVNVVTRALGCYPVAIAVASNIDLNTLDALARSCRSLHDSLIQYRRGLLAATLRCSNETSPVNRDDLLRYRARASNWHYLDNGRSFNGKSGSCAHDFVQACRRCGVVNCATKSPPPGTLRERHRRLCLTCSRAPLATLTHPTLPHTEREAVQRAVCSCDSKAVWLCQPCGRSIRAGDHDYRRIWRWRNHYGEVLGGLGTGIGDGDRGVVCGREENCLNACIRSQEIDCDAVDASAPSDRPPLSPGYRRHEMEGIGGKVKCKMVRTVRVGACVPEYDEEKASGQGRILGPEVKGSVRSWCGWCWRVIPGRLDIGEAV
ncbi:hypothetical protein CDD80_3356 [Ophiocordyceps camponoti-rufipedis]|uniref:Uncharacterized protein n=1 Tax=Ophiocordyceps camponoti-rufipedis TaxID=2004952 RepID=A0A2C5ZNT4_9HYPO|nr:hypothetical protein CDD80_3356 [Ophiocordyceps camponoti-rufipedis]